MKKSPESAVTILILFATTVLLIFITIILANRLRQQNAPESSSANYEIEGIKLCNETCAKDTEACTAGLLCLDGKCRDPQCQSDSTCSCRDSGGEVDLYALRCNSLCGIYYGGCPEPLFCLDSEGDSILQGETGRCRAASCPDNLSCDC